MENVLNGTKSPRRASFVDWQTWMVGCPFFDFISVLDSLLVPPSSMCEAKFFVAYLDYLRRFGVGIRLGHGHIKEGKGKSEKQFKLYEPYYEMLEYSRILAFCVEMPAWKHFFDWKPPVNFEDKNWKEKAQKVLESKGKTMEGWDAGNPRIACYLVRRMEVMNDFCEKKGLFG